LLGVGSLRTILRSVFGARFREIWMAEDHVLKKARDELIRLRRATISALTEGDKHTEHQLDTFIRYQQAIDAIDRLIKEEQLAAEIAADVQPRIKYED
jgi:hypothetical protein